MKIERPNYTIECSEPIIFVDNQARKRSGHMTHAMAEFAPNKLIVFNSNCSSLIYNGHSTFGWVEYRISEDGGKTYSDFYELPYSKQSLYDGRFTISVEKAVACNDGRIVAFCLKNDAHAICQPWDTPTTITSFDAGKTWTEPKELCFYKGRVYDARYHNGVIYALEFCNDATEDYCGKNPDHLYRIYTSHNNGDTFEELCVVPIPTFGRCYGVLLFDDKNNLHVYAYNVNDETQMDHVVSTDFGKTWSKNTPCYLNEGIRNPQLAQMNGVFIAHGRSGAERGFVLYSSLDWQNFDNATFIGDKKGTCYYSNNLVIKDENNEDTLLVQYSEMYGENASVNVMHRTIKVKK